VRWTCRPGSDIFLVLHQGDLFDDWHFQTLTTEVTLKVGAAYSFEPQFGDASWRSPKKPQRPVFFVAQLLWGW
jgi:hypothetical protein